MLPARHMHAADRSTDKQQLACAVAVALLIGFAGTMLFKVRALQRGARPAGCIFTCNVACAHACNVPVCHMSICTADHAVRHTAHHSALHSCIQGAGTWQQQPMSIGIDVLPLPALPPPEQRILDPTIFASSDSLAAGRAEPGLWWYQRPNITNPKTDAGQEAGVKGNAISPGSGPSER